MPKAYNRKVRREMEKEDPMDLESIKTLTDIEKSQRSWPRSRAARDDLIVAGIGSCIWLGVEAISDWFWPPQSREERILEGLQEMKESIKEFNEAEEEAGDV